MAVEVSSPKIHYFNFYGKAEPVRLAFDLAGVKYEDVRFEQSEWASKYKQLAPTGQCPWIELTDSLSLSESKACLLYAATRANLWPSNPLHRAFAFQSINLLESALAPMKSILAKEGDVEAHMKQILEALPRADAMIAKSQSCEQYIAGNELSFADVYVYAYFAKSLPLLVPEGIERMTAAIPHVMKVCETVAQHPVVQKRYATSA